MYKLYNGEYLTKEEIETIRKEEFEKEFFETSLGWIRRKVNMADTGLGLDMIKMVVNNLKGKIEVTRRYSSSP